MQNIHTYDFSNKRALIRVDFNVPLNKETLAVTDDTRIRAAIPTIKKVIENGGSVVLISHLGRPSMDRELRFSLSNIVDHVSKVLGTNVKFGGDCIGKEGFETWILKSQSLKQLKTTMFTSYAVVTY